VSALLEIAALEVEYRTERGRLRALEAVGLALAPGEALGIVGESGAGKSTLARAILGLAPVTRGSIRWQGEEVTGRAPAPLARLRREVAIVFQDAVASLDPRFTVTESVAEPLAVHAPAVDAGARGRAVGQMLERVGLTGALADRYPHELSGGQCQRVAIARAMITRPRLVICDEPWSALDVSVQAQILTLFREFQREDGTALLVISHNLALVRRLCTRVLVLYLGRVAELAPRELLYGAPLHPYTRLLLDSIPVLGRAPRDVAAGEPASPFSPPSGCAFRTRCRHAQRRCAEATPPLEWAGPERAVACWRAGEGVASLPA
jgi:oligopeptide transport system ATP-binding protein